MMKETHVLLFFFSLFLSFLCSWRVLLLLYCHCYGWTIHARLLTFIGCAFRHSFDLSNAFNLPLFLFKVSTFHLFSVVEMTEKKNKKKQHSRRNKTIKAYTKSIEAGEIPTALGANNKANKTNKKKERHRE